MGVRRFDSFPWLPNWLCWFVTARNGPRLDPLSLFEEGTDPMPVVGGLSVVLDGEGSPVCVIRTTRVDVQRFGDVDDTFAWDEGEGDRTLDWWRKAHIRYFSQQGTPINEETPFILERFELLWPTPTIGPSSP